MDRYTWSQIGGLTSGGRRFNPDQAGPSAPDPAMASDPKESALTPKEKGATVAYNPYYDVGNVKSMFFEDPRMKDAYGRMTGGMDAYNQSYGAGSNYLQNEMDTTRQIMQGDLSYVDQAAQAQRQNAQRSIAQQAMMGSRGGMNPAAQRAAIMGASGVQSSMAADVAAAKAQERMQAIQAMAQMQDMKRTGAAGGVDMAQNYLNTTGGHVGSAIETGMAGGAQRVEAVSNVNQDKLPRFGWGNHPTYVSPY